MLITQSRSLPLVAQCIEGMWKVGMSEEVGKALHAVVDRVNQAAARRPKVSQVGKNPYLL